MKGAVTLEDRHPKKSPPVVPDPGEPGGFLLTEPDPIEISSGYSISVKYDKEGRPLIYVKKYGDVDTRGLRREIERNYPGACIQGLEKPRVIKVAEGTDRPKRRQKSRHQERSLF